MFNCGGLGHFAIECRKPKREKEPKQEANLTQIQDDEPALLLNETDTKSFLINEEEVTPKLVNNEDTRSDSNLWYLDNGASNHMTWQRSKFRELDENITGQVKFGDGSVVDIKGRGTVVFRCKNGEDMVFNQVYFIPNLCSNIISLGQLAEKGNKVILNGLYLWIYDQQKRLVMKVKKFANQLYKIILETSMSKCFMSKLEEESWRWHSRLGHVNFQAMTLMSSKHMVHGIPELGQPKGVCSGCLMAKQTRRSFPSQTSFRASHPLELIHGDLCGPISPETKGGNRYFMLLVDDYTRVMWAYMLVTKDEALEAFKKFRVLVETSTEHKVKMLRTDRGGEFCSNRFAAYCEDTGVARQYTTPYTPQQNGVVERRNRTVVAMARSFLKEKKLPSSLWGEAVRHSVYVLNRLPTRSLSEKTPYEAWTGNKPDLGHLRVFGCAAYMKVPANQITKLDDRSRMVVYLGREPGTKGCRLYDLESGKIMVSRDVVCDESKGWSWQVQQCGSQMVQGSFVVSSMTSGVLTTAESEGHEQEPVTPVSSRSESENSVTIPQTPGTGESNFESEPSSISSSSTEPVKFRLLSDIYDEAPEVELENELLLAGIDEPSNFSQAVTEGTWKKAMEQEIEAIEKNRTWKLVELPSGHKPIGLKWVYKLKRDANGNVIKHKARLVAKGYVQKQGVDYDEVFVPVTRLETVRLLLALAAKNEWEVHHLDVKSAFLNGELQEIVYVKQPEGFVKENEEHKVYQLIKALYGLRQAPRA